MYTVYMFFFFVKKKTRMECKLPIIHNTSIPAISSYKYPKMFNGISNLLGWMIWSITSSLSPFHLCKTNFAIMGQNQCESLLYKCQPLLHVRKTDASNSGNLK